MNKDIIEDDGFITICPKSVENANDLYRAYNITCYMQEVYRAYSHCKTQSHVLRCDRKPCPLSAEEMKTLHRICIPIADAVLIGEKIDKTGVPFSVALRKVMGWK